MLISKYCIDLIINSIIETLYLLIITFLSDMLGMKCKQYIKLNEYFDPDIDFGIKQYVADYQAVYLTFDIETSLMWQSGVVAKGQNKSATSLGDCGRGEINKFLFRWRVARGPCNS